MIAVTGGAGAPLVVATISGISGAVSAGTQSLTSQYVETGDLSDTDWGEVGKDAFIGGLAGFATGYIGTAGSQAITSSLSKVQSISQLLNSSSTATRLVSNFAIGAGSESLTGMGSRFAGTFISTNGDLGAAWNSASDVKSILIDVGIGGSYGAVRGFKKPETAVDEFIIKDSEVVKNVEADGDVMNNSSQMSSAERIAQNRTKGREFEVERFSEFSSNYDEAVEQITIKTPSGVRTRVDAIGLSSDGEIVIQEFKSSSSAPLTPNQKVAFPEIFEHGGTVVGKGKGIFTGGFEIPKGTSIEIIRP